MRMVLRKFAAGCLAALFLLSSSAAALSPVRSFDASGFTDIPNDWSRSYIISCYELGLLFGRGGNTFAPAGNLSVAEAIMVTARVHSLWKGGSGEFSDGDSWFSGAVSYAVEKGIIAAGEFPDLSAAATRTQLAVLLSRALPAEDYAPINTVSSLPDVNSDASGFSDILTLYEAGILTGADAFGAFHPDAPITRAELSAILCRLVLPETRKRFSLQIPQEDPPVLLNAASFEEQLDTGKLTAVLFFANWCVPCQNFASTFNQLAASSDVPLFLGRINVDIETDLVQRYHILNYPTVVFFRDGAEINRIVGNNPLETYIDFLTTGL